MTTPAPVQRPRLASSSASGSATVAVTVQLPSRTRCPNGAKPSASPVSPRTASLLPSGTRCRRSAQAQASASRTVTAQGTRTRSTAPGSSACGTAARTALGRYRKCGSSYGEPPASQVRAARTTIALSIPPSEVVRAAWAADAASTVASTAHGCRPAGRTNHPEMSLLPVRMHGTLGPAGPKSRHQHAHRPV